MSPFTRRCSRSSVLVLHLTFLWTVGWSAATQPKPSAVNTAIDPEKVLGLIVHEVTTKVESLISQLASRIEGLDSRLINVDSRLTSVDSRLSGIESRLNILDFKQDAFDASLDDHSSRIESAEARLDSGLAPLTSRMNLTDSKLDELVSKVSTMDGKLEAGLIPLTSGMNSTEARREQLESLVNTTEGRASFRVEDLLSPVNGTSAGQSDRPEGVTYRFDALSPRLDDLANSTDTLRSPPRDCSGLPAGARSGIYQLHLEPFQPPVTAYCDLEADGGGWTVIQRRKDIEPRQDFNLNWTDYREGFGDLHREFWWGLQNMWKLTGADERHYELRVTLADFEGCTRQASYSRFRVGSEVDGYQLTVSGYSGTAGDSLSRHNGRKFSTKDRDQDEDAGSCAQKYKGGWWFYYCYRSFLNGPSLYGEQDEREGIVWSGWRGYHYSLKETEMKIRPVSDTD